jgi:hypothetical protein
MDNKDLKKMNEKQEVKKELKELTLDEFINKAVEKCESQKKELKIPILDFGLITFKRPTNDQTLDYINAQGNSIRFSSDGKILGTDLVNLSKAASELIYFICPYLQNTDLQEALGIKDPLDMPIKVFGIENLIDIANLINNKFGLGKKIKKSIKN